METPSFLRTLVRTLYRWRQSKSLSMKRASLDAAIEEAGLTEIREKLRKIQPDIQDQYTCSYDTEMFRDFWEPKIRSNHAFQVQGVLDAIDAIGKKDLFIADIGDSSGNHSIYIKALVKPGQVSRIVSVNLDPVAVEKVRAKGGEAILCRAENLELDGLKPDLFLSFQMVEHLTDPIGFVHKLATAGSADHLLISVPYVRKSRFGGSELRNDESLLPESMNAEQLHIFELSPLDWSRLFTFAGFRPVWTRILRQYPLRHPLRVTASQWREDDFEGFVMFFLKRDLSVANRYTDWG